MIDEVRSENEAAVLGLWLLFGKVFTKYRPELISAGDWYGVNMLQMCSVTKAV